ncbi:MAG: sigma-54-dependent transcriptional regulator [bacterium]
MFDFKRDAGKKSVYSLPCMNKERRPSRYLMCSRNPQVGQVFKTLGKLLDSNIPLLFCGETGVGKSTFAKIVHDCGKQRQGTFLRIDCCNTDAHDFIDKIISTARVKENSFNENGTMWKSENVFFGTIFLHDIGHLPDDFQVKLISILKEKKIVLPSNGEKLAMNARFVSSTQHDLWSLVEKGRFRKDLFYRLSIYTFLLPPLRDRKIDIGDFTNHFCHLYAAQNKSNLPVFTKEAIVQLKQHTWPGNIHEFHEVIMKTIAASNGETTTISDIAWPPKHNSRQKENINTSNRNASTFAKENNKGLSSRAGISTLTS